MTDIPEVIARLREALENEDPEYGWIPGDSDDLRALLDAYASKELGWKRAFIWKRRASRWRQLARLRREQVRELDDERIHFSNLAGQLQAERYDALAELADEKAALQKAKDKISRFEEHKRRALEEAAEEREAWILQLQTELDEERRLHTETKGRLAGLEK